MGFDQYFDKMLKTVDYWLFRLHIYTWSVHRITERKVIRDMTLYVARFKHLSD